MNVSGFWGDLKKMLSSLRERSRFLGRKKEGPKRDPVKELAQELHPSETRLRIERVEEAGKGARRYTLVPVEGGLPPFEAGQFLSFDFDIDGVKTTRAYSLSSAPSSALDPKHPHLQVVVKRIPDGFVSPYIHENWKEGAEVVGHLPYGEFSYRPLQDSQTLCFLAGGSAITPFLSLLKDIREKGKSLDVTLLYGVKREEDILCREELEALRGEHMRIVYVVSGDPSYPGEKGFLSAELIQKYVSGDATYFVCGPAAMMDFALGELAKIGVPKKRIRAESQGAKLHEHDPSYPLKEKAVFHCLVHRGCREDMIEAPSDMPLSASLEKAGILIHTCCHSGVCGACRIRLVSGSLYVPSANDGRRAAEKELGYYYACSSYPCSDLEIEAKIVE